MENKNTEQWPGRGPYSYLPPWQRPGQAHHGRGYGNRHCVYKRYFLTECGWDPKHAYQTTVPITQEEIATLEEYKKELEQEKASLEQEISSTETRLKELKEFEHEKNRQ